MEKKLKKNILIELGIIFLIMLLSACKAFYFGFDANDELWNFSNIYKMYIGYNIYEDINVIVTPLFFYIGEIIFKIIGANYLSFRIYNVLINFFLFYLIYNIFKALKLKTINALAYMLIIFSVVSVTMSAGANYNSLVIVFFLLGILVNLKIKDDKWYLPYLQGVILFLIFMTKQNIGIFYFIGCIIYYILKSINEKKIKNQIIFLFKQSIIFFVLCIAFLLFLIINNNLNGFINYCVLGLVEFGTKNIYIGIEIFPAMVIIVISIVYSCILIRLKNISNEIKKVNIKILPFGIMCIFMAYPIFNRYHVYLTTILWGIILLYNMHNTIIIEFLKEKLINIICIIISITIIIYTIFFAIIGNNSFFEKLQRYIEPYYGSMMKQEQITSIKEICEYILNNEKKGVDVKIISYKSNMYMNVLKKNNGALDLPFYGNLGKKGEDGIINDIALMNNTKILIQKEEKIHEQESVKIRNYIKENLNYEGDIGEFLIYSK